MHLASSAIASYERARDRSLDILDLKGHITRVLDEALSHVDSPVRDMKIPDGETEFLFGGYSWVRKRFYIWNIRYGRSEKKFIAHDSATWFGQRSQIAFGGDWKVKGRNRLIQHLHKKHGVWPQTDKKVFFDWEPFEILRDILRVEGKDQNESVGGPPQILKIYQHHNARSIGVYWPSKEAGRATIAGRHVLSYETPACWILDPDTLRTSHPYISDESDAVLTAQPKTVPTQQGSVVLP